MQRIRSVEEFNSLDDGTLILLVTRHSTLASVNVKGTTDKWSIFLRDGKIHWRATHDRELYDQAADDSTIWQSFFKSYRVFAGFLPEVRSCFSALGAMNGINVERLHRYQINDLEAFNELPDKSIIAVLRDQRGGGYIASINVKGAGCPYSICVQNSFMIWRSDDDRENLRASVDPGANGERSFFFSENDLYLMTTQSSAGDLNWFCELVSTEVLDMNLVGKIFEQLL
jgi:hypothetical protein